MIDVPPPEKFNMSTSYPLQKVPAKNCPFHFHAADYIFHMIFFHYYYFSSLPIE